MEREEPGETRKRLSNEELALFKRQIAACATEIWRVVAEAGLDPSDIRVYCAFGLIWALGSKGAGKTKEEFLLAAEDAYENSVAYEADLEEEDSDGKA